MSVAVVLSLDHWNAGLSGFCGGEPLLTPSVDRLAAESAVFDQHFSVEPAGDRSVNGRAWAGEGWGSGPAEIRAADRFDAAGVDVEILADTAFDWFEIAGWTPEVTNGDGLQQRVTSAIDRLATGATDHRLLWVAVSAPTEAADGPWPDHLEEIDSAMAAWDQVVAAAVTALDQCGLADRVLLVVTGGRGAGLGDRGFEDDRLAAALHEERLRTPLLLRGPEIEPGQRRLELVQVIDMLPTLLEWFGTSSAVEDLGGISLLQLLQQDGRGGREEIVVRDAGGDWGIRSRDLFLVRSSEDGDATQLAVPARLFSKPDDAWDLVDVSEQGVDDVERLVLRLDELIAAID